MPPNGPSRVAGGKVQSSSSSGIFFQEDGQSQVVGNSHLSSSFGGNSFCTLPRHAQGIMGQVSGEISNKMLNSVSSSGPSVGASSLVTDANSGLSGGPHLQRSASINTESYMRMPTSPMSFSSNNLSITCSSVIDGSSIGQQSSHQDPGSQQMQQSQQHPIASSATSLPTSRMGQVQIPGGSRIPNSFDQDPANISQLQKKPRLDIKQEDILQQQVLQQLIQRQDSMQLQSSTPHFQALMQQQRLRQKQQQQQLLQSMPPMQQAQLLQQQQHQQLRLRQQLQQQGVQQTSGVKRPFDSGVCSRRLMQYLYHQRQRPADNSITYWRKFVAEYYSPRAKKRWCLSLYDNIGHHSLGVFAQAAMDAWQCDICGSKSGRGFEATSEVLPRLNEIKFSSGVTDELLFLDLPREYRFPSGVMMLEYAKAVEETVYDELRVVREGQLRIIFTPDLKILSWEFCAQRHEELLPRRLVTPQVNQLLQVAQKCYSTISESGPDGVSQQDLQANSVMVVTAGRQLARSLGLQSLDDLGFSKRYVRCLQIAAVVNSMKDLMDFCKEQKTGPTEGLKNFPCHSSQPKVQLQKMEEVEQMDGLHDFPTDRSPLNKLMILHPGITGQMNNQHMVGSGALSGSAQAALALTNYQNLLMRQNSMNSTNNSLQQEASFSFTTSSKAPSSTTPASSGILPGTLQNLSPLGFLNSQIVQEKQSHQHQHSLNGNPLSQQIQSFPTQSSQALQQQMIQQLLQDMTNKNWAAQSSSSVQNLCSLTRDGLAFKNSPVTSVVGIRPGSVAGLPPSRSGGLKVASNDDSSILVGNVGSVQKASDFPQNLHLPDDLVQDIAAEFTENGFFNNDLDDSPNFSWKV